MPPNSPRVAIDSRPRLSGILDTINATRAHGPETRLPSEFYDSKAREICDQITADEWFSGYKESREYRKLGVGALMGDIVDRMVSASVGGGWRPGTKSGGSPVKFAISGCHDTTIAGILTSLGAFDNGKWPPFSSSVAIELFADTNIAEDSDIAEEPNIPVSVAQPTTPSKPLSWLSYLIGHSPSLPSTHASWPSNTARTSLSTLPSLRNHYVRIRYNDQPMRIPSCAANPANHLPGDETFCTLEAFKEIADKFTPANWREECGWNLDKGMFGEREGERQEAGC